MKIGIYISKSKTERNKGFVVVYAYDRDWPENVLRQRCLLGNRIFVRDAFPHEIEEREASHRAVSYRYPDLKSLIDDERLAGCDNAALKAIETAIRNVRGRVT